MADKAWHPPFCARDEEELACPSCLAPFSVRVREPENDAQCTGCGQTEADINPRKECETYGTAGHHMGSITATNEEIAEVLDWLMTVIAHEIEPPKSCGACGTPWGSCGGECVDAVYFSRGMGRASTLLRRLKGNQP